MRVGCLVVARAPVAGEAKTRIARRVGPVAAADLAAASLLDTLTAVEAYRGADERMVALTGSLRQASRGEEIAARLMGWSVTGQRGSTFARRIVAAHGDAADAWGDAVVVQIGMDTPQLVPGDLEALAAACTPARATAGLGPAEDGGWWGLATPRAGYLSGLSQVAMSTRRTRADTTTAIRAAGADVCTVHTLRDMDTWADAVAIAEAAPHTHLAAAVHRVRADAPSAGRRRENG